MTATQDQVKKAEENLALLKRDLEKVGAQMFLLHLERQYRTAGFAAMDEVLK